MAEKEYYQEYRPQIEEAAWYSPVPIVHGADDGTMKDPNALVLGPNQWTFDQAKHFLAPSKDKANPALKTLVDRPKVNGKTIITYTFARDAELENKNLHLKKPNILNEQPAISTAGVPLVIPPQLQQEIIASLGEYAKCADIEFRPAEAGKEVDADFRFLMDFDQDSNCLAYMHRGDNAGDKAFIVLNAAKDNFSSTPIYKFYKKDENTEKENALERSHTYLHEIGHALGLGHPFDGCRVCMGQAASNKAGEDIYWTQLSTIMSYVYDYASPGLKRLDKLSVQNLFGGKEHFTEFNKDTFKAEDLPTLSAPIKLNKATTLDFRDTDGGKVKWTFLKKLDLREGRIGTGINGHMTMREKSALKPDFNIEFAPESVQHVKKIYFRDSGLAAFEVLIGGDAGCEYVNIKTGPNLVSKTGVALKHEVPVIVDGAGNDVYHISKHYDESHIEFQFSAKSGNNVIRGFTPGKDENLAFMADGTITGITLHPYKRPSTKTDKEITGTLVTWAGRTLMGEDTKSAIFVEGVKPEDLQKHIIRREPPLESQRNKDFLTLDEKGVKRGLTIAEAFTGTIDLPFPSVPTDVKQVEKKQEPQKEEPKKEEPKKEEPKKEEKKPEPVKPELKKPVPVKPAPPEELKPAPKLVPKPEEEGKGKEKPGGDKVEGVGAAKSVNTVSDPKQTTAPGAAKSTPNKQEESFFSLGKGIGAAIGALVTFLLGLGPIGALIGGVVGWFGGDLVEKKVADKKPVESATNKPLESKPVVKDEKKKVTLAPAAEFDRILQNAPELTSIDRNAYIGSGLPHGVQGQVNDRQAISPLS